MALRIPWFGRNNENSSKYLYEYKTRQNKWCAVEIILHSVTAAIPLWGIFHLVRMMSMDWDFFEQLTQPTNAMMFTAIGSYILILIPLFVLFMAVSNSDSIPLDGSIPLIVRVSQKEIFARQYLGRKFNFHERIPVVQIKSASAKLYTVKEFHSLYNTPEVYEFQKKFLGWFERRRIFTDGSSRHDNQVFGEVLGFAPGSWSSYNGYALYAVLELFNGRQFYFEFKDAENFVTTLDSLRPKSRLIPDE